MTIAIDGYEANQLHRVGIGEYAYQIIRELYALSLQKDKSHLNFRIYLPEKPLADMPEPTQTWKYIVRSPKRFWTFLALPYSLHIDKPKASVVFSPTHYVPRFVDMPKVMSIMDVSYLYFPELFRKKDLYQLKEWTKHSVDHAAYVFTISEFSKNAIIKEYKYPHERIIVTYPGMREGKKITMNTVSQIKEKFSIHKPYLLSVGTLQPRKNYERLIEAFSQVVTIADYKDYELVIVGKKGWLYEEILEAPKRYNVDTQVKFLDYVADDDLPALYASAECFALPSLYEGFGLPALEAMANDCPVVVSNVSSLPEIVGDAGILVDPNSASDIARGIQQALQEKNTKEGKTRIVKGQKRVKSFSWQESAKKTLEILEQVGSGGS